MRRYTSDPGIRLPIKQRTRQNEDEIMPTSKERLPERFQVQKIIGQGSYGCVVEAFDEQNGRMVAVKRVDKLFRNHVDCKRVLREIAIMSKLSHPCIVQLFDLPLVTDVSTFDELFIVMELCDTDMGKLLKAEVSISPSHTTALLYNLLRGLKYLHSAAIYHRDLKPANCFVNADCSVKIGDFGLARAVEELSPISSELQRNSECEELPDDGAQDWTICHAPDLIKRQLTTHVATRWYRAPELILLQKGYTAAVDVWSVGCIYAELLGMHDGVKFEDRQPLFPGSSCYPLSPLHANAGSHACHSVSVHDQLSLIFDIIGVPQDADVLFLEREDARSYIRRFPGKDGEGISKAFKHAGEDAIAVLEGTLRFNPLRRPNIDELLDYEIFAACRDSSSETVAPSVVKLDFEGFSLDELRLRSHLFKEMKKAAVVGGA
jgi:mitogen-activated protein kinase 1/3